MKKKFLTLIALLCCALPITASAQDNVQSVAKYAYITDYNSGRVLMNKAGDEAMKPASMAKIMTTYLAFERIADGTLSLDDTFVVSEKAWKKGGLACSWTLVRLYLSEIC